VDEFKKKFGESEQFALLKMYQLYKEKKYAEAENVLRSALKNGQVSSIFKLYLAQVLLCQGKLNEAVELFKTLDEFKVFKLGLVSRFFS
jgi:predicted negative regulator of RcsB-dependent stress response